MFKGLTTGLALTVGLAGFTCSASALDECLTRIADWGLFEQSKLYLQNGGNWTELPEGERSVGTANPHLMYVTRDMSGDERVGVLVIKTGRKLTDLRADVELTKKQVMLARISQTLKNDPCGPVSDFVSATGSVSAKSYDDYHDLAYDPADQAELATLDSFHIKYAGRHKACKDTNSVTSDSLLRRDLRSNRSQFSFDPEVVRHGMYSQFLASLRIRSAQASSRGLADQRVQMRRYAMGPEKAACVQFDVNVSGSNFFLRLNDLDARTGRARAQEHSWVLNR